MTTDKKPSERLKPLMHRDVMPSKHCEGVHAILDEHDAKLNALMHKQEQGQPSDVDVARWVRGGDTIWRWSGKDKPYERWDSGRYWSATTPTNLEFSEFRTGFGIREVGYSEAVKTQPAIAEKYPPAIAEKLNALMPATGDTCKQPLPSSPLSSRPCASSASSLSETTRPTDPTPDASGRAERAKEWAVKMIYNTEPKNLAMGHHAKGIGSSVFLPEFEVSIIEKTKREWRQFIAEALTAFAAAEVAEVEKKFQGLLEQAGAEYGKRVAAEADRDQLRLRAEAAEKVIEAWKNFIADEFSLTKLQAFRAAKSAFAKLAEEKP